MFGQRRHHHLDSAPSGNDASEDRFSGGKAAVALDAHSVVAPFPARVFGSALGSALVAACLPVSNRILATCPSQGSVGGWASLRHVGNGRQNWLECTWTEARSRRWTSRSLRCLRVLP